MYFPPFRIPVTLSDNANPGSFSPSYSAASVSAVTLGVGYYKIAAASEDVLWKKGSTAVTDTTGSFLAAGDQEVILVEDADTVLTWIRSPDASGDGKFNVVPVEFMEVPGRDGFAS